MPDQPHLEDDPLWYRDAVIYQLNVKAFLDSNRDGMGDFKGVTEKLDYVKDLSMNAIWLMPFYPSPLRDDGSIRTYLVSGIASCELLEETFERPDDLERLLVEQCIEQLRQRAGTNPLLRRQYARACTDRLGLTQREIAMRLGVSHVAIHKLLVGRK